jgi:hypothetical protein
LKNVSTLAAGRRCSDAAKADRDCDEMLHLTALKYFNVLARGTGRGTLVPEPLLSARLKRSIMPGNPTSRWIISTQSGFDVADGALQGLTG